LKSHVLPILVGAVSIGLGFGLGLGTYSGLGGGLVAALVGGLYGGLSIRKVETKATPNQGIRLSAKNALTYGLIIGIVGGLVVGLSSGLIIGLGGGLLAGLIAGLVTGGRPSLQHLLLRLLLVYNGFAPWKYSEFLD
jgi:hypothetical protein